MRQWRDFPLPDGSYSDDTRPWSQQDVVNYLPTFAEASGTRSRVLYKCAPGLHTLAIIGTGPHRGAHDVEGSLFVVSGQNLYQVAADGSASNKGTIPGTGFVSMAHNQIDGGNQLLIGTRDNSYVYNNVTGTLAATGVPLQSVEFLNQRMLGVDVGRRFWRYSALADATDWNTLDNESAESSPDRIIGGCVSQGEWLVFGERTIEVWRNDPTVDTAFQRGEVIEKGCANANTIKRLDNSVFWLGNDLIVYRLNGYQAVPVSTKAQAAAFHACDPAKAFAFTYEDRGYVVFYLTFQDGQTWGFDVTSSKWHRRESFGLDRWRLNTLTKWNGEWYGGDYSGGKLSKLVWGQVYEGADIFPRSLRTAAMHANGNRVRIHGFRLLANTGAEPSSLALGGTLRISGDLPNGGIDDIVSYQYTVTPAYAEQAVVCTISSGALPTGLTMDANGLVTGTLTEAGTFTWTVLATAIDGTASLVDSALVARRYYLAVGDSGQIYTAPDLPATWTAQTSGTTQPLQAITQGAANLIVCGGAGSTPVLLYSTDRTTWHSATVPASITTALLGVASSGTSAIAVSFPGGTADGKIARSTDDGVTWAAVTAPTGCGPLTGIHYAAGKYVACSSIGKVIVSTDDGQTWTKYTAGADFAAITYHPTSAEWMAVGSRAETATATDPTGAWTARSAAGGTSYSFLCVAPGLSAGHYIAGSNNGAPFGGIYVTTNSGATWTRNAATSQDINGIAKISARVVAVSQFSAAWDSTDESAWASHTILTGTAMNGIADGIFSS